MCFGFRLCFGFGLCCRYVFRLCSCSCIICGRGVYILKVGGTCPAVTVGSYEVGAFFVYPVVGDRMVASE